MCNVEKKRLPVGIESFEEIRNDGFSDSVLMDGLKILSGLLRKHYGKKFIIL